MLMDVLILTTGFILLIAGANYLVDSASALAAKYGISAMVIGLTIVAFGTSAPELVVNVYASIEKSSGMVLGNVLGSNIFNLLFILGVISLMKPLTVKKNTTWSEIPLNLLAAISVFVIANDIFLSGDDISLINRSEGILLLLFFCIFLAYNVSISMQDEEEAEQADRPRYSIGKSIVFMLLGLAGLIVGGRFIVQSGVSIAETFGWSERLIGLTIISIGTSLPELATSVVAVRKGNVDIAIGNVVGSNIFNIFFILGVSAVINPVEVSASSQLDILLNIIAGALLFIFLFTGRGRQLERWEGVIFLMVYLGYLYLLISQPG